MKSKEKSVPPASQAQPDSKTVTDRSKPALPSQNFSNAAEFHREVVEKLDPNSMIKILFEHFSYYFFSHIQNLELKILDIGEIVFHFSDFFVYSTTMYQGNHIGRAYASYYVINR